MATYYVKNGGDDGAAGTSDETAWATLAKVNSTTFSAGDTILLAKGSTWREEFYLTAEDCSGSDGLPITIDAYGTGADPQILGSSSLVGAGNWTQNISVGGKPAATADDVFCSASTLYNTTLRMGNSAGTSVDMGVRCCAVAIPQGATIVAAYLYFCSDDDRSGADCNVRIYGEDVDDSATFSTLEDFTGRTKTTAYVDWSAIPAWETFKWYSSPDIKTVVQEIVDREGWVSGNDMTFFLDDNSSTGSASRAPCDVSQHPRYTTRLFVLYSGSTANIWNTALPVSWEVGNVIYNDGVGVYRDTLGALEAQGDFYYNKSTGGLSVYSTANPGTAYTTLEACQAHAYNDTIFGSYVTIRNLDFRYNGWHCLELRGGGHNVVERCDFVYCGGAYMDSSRRDGGCLEMIVSQTDVTIRNCYFDNLWEGGVRLDAGGNNVVYARVNIYGNVFVQCYHGISIEFTTYTGCGVSGLNFSHNVVYDVGGGDFLEQRPTYYPSCIYLPNNNAMTSSVMYNNIFHTTNTYWWNVGTTEDISGLTADYNCYYADSGTLFHYHGSDYSFADWKTETSKDAHSITTDPTFETLGSDWRLKTGSPCIDTGTDAGLYLNKDGDAYDMGAYEYPHSALLLKCAFRKP